MAETLNEAVRTAKRQQHVPATAKCVDCAVTDPRVLCRAERKWRCYRCENVRRGLSGREKHHLLGRAVSSVTLDVDANLHRILSEEQLNIPDSIARRSAHDPLVWVIRVLCMIRGWCKLLVDWLTRAIEWLGRLLAALERRFGAQWADALQLPAIAA